MHSSSLLLFTVLHASGAALEELTGNALNMPASGFVPAEHMVHTNDHHSSTLDLTAAYSPKFRFLIINSRQITTHSRSVTFFCSRGLLLSPYNTRASPQFGKFTGATPPSIMRQKRGRGDMEMLASPQFHPMVFIVAHHAHSHTIFSCAMYRIIRVLHSSHSAHHALSLLPTLAWVETR